MRKEIIGNATLYCGDCLEEMKLLPDGCADMVLCDLPYGTTRNKWDSVIDLPSIWKEYRRIVNGAIVLFCAQPFTSVLISSNLRDFRYDWTWVKPKGTGHLNAKKQPMRDKEDIAVFYQRHCTYNPQMTAGAPYKDKAGKDHSKSTSMTGSYGAYTNFREENHGTRYPKQVLHFSVVERGTQHPTQKPVDLCEYLIRTYTNEGDVVLDNTMGSGTTGVAAVQMNRKFIGIELNEKYFSVACNRLEDSQRQGDFFY